MEQLWTMDESWMDKPYGLFGVMCSGARTIGYILKWYEIYKTNLKFS